MTVASKTLLIVISAVLVLDVTAVIHPPSQHAVIAVPSQPTIVVRSDQLDQRELRASRSRPLAVARSHPARVVKPVRPARRARGRGVSFSYLELRVRSCESGRRGYATGGRALDFNYTDSNRYSSASGAWQFLDSTWAHFMGYARAKYAPRWVQDLKARRYIDKVGLRPWYASRSCWGR